MLQRFVSKFVDNWDDPPRTSCKSAFSVRALEVCVANFVKFMGGKWGGCCGTPKKKEGKISFLKIFQSELRVMRLTSPYSEV